MDSIQLGFTVGNAALAPQAEEQMLAQVNAERLRVGLDPLVPDAALRRLASAYGTELLGFGYFSHTDLAGRSPFYRMITAGISYSAAGENLALAPDVEAAQAGLLNSPGHRANILSPNFHKIGIGVVSAGPRGLLFVQEFTG